MKTYNSLNALDNQLHLTFVALQTRKATKTIYLLLLSHPWHFIWNSERWFLNTDSWMILAEALKEAYNSQGS